MHTLKFPPQIDYNVLAYLRKLLGKLRIYDALILFKEMSKSLIKASLDPKILLAYLVVTSHKNPYDYNYSQRLTLKYYST